MNRIEALTIETWQPLSPTPLDEREAQEIVANMVGFMQILRRWRDRRDEQQGPGA